MNAIKNQPDGYARWLRDRAVRPDVGDAWGGTMAPRPDRHHGCVRNCTRPENGGTPLTKVVAARQTRSPARCQSLEKRFATPEARTVT